MHKCSFCGARFFFARKYREHVDTHVGAIYRASPDYDDGLRNKKVVPSMTIDDDTYDVGPSTVTTTGMLIGGMFNGPDCQLDGNYNPHAFDGFKGGESAGGGASDTWDAPPAPSGDITPDSSSVDSGACDTGSSDSGSCDSGSSSD